MFCIVTVLCEHVLYCECYTYVFCIVTVLRVHVLYCDSVIRTCFVLWQCYAYMFCIVTVLCEKKLWKSLIYSIALSTKYCDKNRTCLKSIWYFASDLQDVISSIYRWQHAERWNNNRFSQNSSFFSDTINYVFLKLVVILCTTYVSIKIISIFTTKRIYGFRMALKISSYLIYEYY
jgi:hypothetical protein